MVVWVQVTSSSFMSFRLIWISRKLRVPGTLCRTDFHGESSASAKPCFVVRCSGQLLSVLSRPCLVKILWGWVFVSAAERERELTYSILSTCLPALHAYPRQRHRRLPELIPGRYVRVAGRANGQFALSIHWVRLFNQNLVLSTRFVPLGTEVKEL